MKKKKTEPRNVRIKTNVNVSEAEKIDTIVKKYRFRSRYQLFQYLVRSFLKVADPEPGEYVSKDIEEMFEGFQEPSKEDFQDIKRGSAV